MGSIDVVVVTTVALSLNPKKSGTASTTVVVGTSKGRFLLKAFSIRQKPAMAATLLLMSCWRLALKTPVRMVSLQIRAVKHCFCFGERRQSISHLCRFVVHHCCLVMQFSLGFPGSAPGLLKYAGFKGLISFVVLEFRFG